MAKRKHSEAQTLLGIHLRELGFQQIEYEYHFFEERKWACDLYLPEVRILLECDGGMRSGGHKRGAALEDDYYKQNTAQLLGYRILRFSNRQVLTGEAKEWISRWFDAAKPRVVVSL